MREGLMLRVPADFACLLGKDCSPNWLPFAASLLLCRWGGQPSCWLSIVDTGSSLLLKAESALVSLYAIAALSYLEVCLSPLVKEKR